MFQRAKTFVQNHWKKAVVGGIVFQVAGIGIRYATNRLLLHQEDQARLYWLKVKKQQHFENLEENCIITFRELVEIMKTTIVTTLDAETLQERLRTNQIQNKVEAWNELKLIAFIRTLSTIYGTSLLYVLVRVQLSVLGGYLWTAQSGSPGRSSSSREGLKTSGVKISPELQKKYLQLAHYLATEGIVKIIECIKVKVSAVVSNLPLKQAFSGTDLEQTFWAIIRKEQVNDQELPSPWKNSWKYIFPNELLQDTSVFQPEQPFLNSTDIYRKLICETYDLLESDDVKDIMRFLESHGVSNLVDRVTDTLESVPVESSSDCMEVFTEPKIAFPKLISFMNSLHLIDVLDDPWVNLLISSESVRVMSANIYEAFSADE